MAIMQTLSIYKDPSRQIIWFAGKLADGHQFAVGFPIAHVVVTFDQQAGSIGWANMPVCAGIPSIEGFFDGIAQRVAQGGRVAQVTKTTQQQTMQNLGSQALHYATAATGFIPKSVSRMTPSHAAPAISAAGLASYHAAHLVSQQAKNPNAARNLAARLRSMVANPHPQAQLTLAGLQSYRP